MAASKGLPVNIQPHIFLSFTSAFPFSLCCETFHSASLKAKLGSPVGKDCVLQGPKEAVGSDIL